MLQIETIKSSNNVNNSFQFEEKLQFSAANTQTEKLSFQKTEETANGTAQQQQSYLPIKHKPSDVIENALNKYLKLKAVSFNLDKIIEVL